MLHSMKIRSVALEMNCKQTNEHGICCIQSVCFVQKRHNKHRTELFNLGPILEFYIKSLFILNSWGKKKKELDRFILN
jgi:hypothetical protein